MPLLEAIEEHRFDALFGGGRRDEEKARAKERVSPGHRERLWPPGPQEPTPRAVERLYNPVICRARALPGVSAEQLTELTSGSTSRPTTWSCRRSTTPISARCSCATACGCRWTPRHPGRRRGGRDPHGAVPHGGRRQLHRRGGAGSDERRRSSRRRPRPRDRAGATC
ncbi:MAG: phosphoadenosine phosphosulfate reductase family protein [Microthrixaceae bacterium]